MMTNMASSIGASFSFTRRGRILLLGWFLGTLLLLMGKSSQAASYYFGGSGGSSNSQNDASPKTYRVAVLVRGGETWVARKVLQDLRHQAENAAAEGATVTVQFEVTTMEFKERRDDIEQRGCLDEATFKEFFKNLRAYHQEHLSAEMWKWCALYSIDQQQHQQAAAAAGEVDPTTWYDAGLYLDVESPSLVPWPQYLAELWSQSPEANLAVLGDSDLFPGTMHGSAFLWQFTQHPNQATERVNIPQRMLQLLATTPIDVLIAKPLLQAEYLYNLIVQDLYQQQTDALSASTDLPLLVPGLSATGTWQLLQQSCIWQATAPSAADPQAAWAKNSQSRVATTTGAHLVHHVQLPLRRWPPQPKPLADEYSLTHNCPPQTGFCCAIRQHAASTMASPMGVVVMMTRYVILPVQVLPPHPPAPLMAATQHYQADELPFVSVVRVQSLADPYPTAQARAAATPNFYHMLQAKDNHCLPEQDDCTECLREKKGANCETCARACRCYCTQLCQVEIPAKPVSKVVMVQPPVLARDPRRLIPRIIHQTWWEPLTAEEYPNMSRMVESFRQSGWEYKFYHDADAASFLSTHFPPEVRQAYDDLIPGAFKADLFRYCVLLIHGGVYADVDILLESNLDQTIPPDVGLMMPIDEPGIPVGKQMCLWNGLIAAAPGHPVLAKAIETVVNQVRNRFTSVDVDATFCPNPELSITHAYDTLFTAGPCLLGAVLNRVLGRHGQTPFVPGELDPWQLPPDAVGANRTEEELEVARQEHRERIQEATSFVETAPDAPLESRIPGRIVILKQNKWDMGAHRFTLEESNVVVAATDLPDANDREKLQTTGTNQHYSTAHAKVGIYGVEGLYKDRTDIAHQNIQIIVNATLDAKRVYG